MGSKQAWKSIRRMLSYCLASLWSSFRDMLPIVITVAGFQIFVFQKNLDNIDQLLIGLVLVISGLALFIAGLEMGLFPLGEQMARDFTRKGSITWLAVFAFSLGFGTTFAEPALIAISRKAADLASQERLAAVTLNHPGGATLSEEQQLEQEAATVQFANRYALILRTVVGVAVGAALVLGVFRIIRGWPLHYLIVVGYLLVMILTPFAPSNIIGVAYDAGGVATSTITVPLTAALGIGLASCIKGRNSMLDGFGLIALACLTPIIFVLLLGIIWT